jgi:2'-5' RNA ligase
MRVFVALDIEQPIRERMQRFMDEVRTRAPNVRWVSPESLHVTLKFIGERPDAMVTSIQSALGTVSASSFQLSFRGVGFFPTEKSARVFWAGIQAGDGFRQLAGEVEKVLVPLGIPPEKRAFSPHLTLARAGDGSGAPGRQPTDKLNRRFAGLQAGLGKTNVPEFGTMTAEEFWLYRSQLSSRGAQYTKIARFPLAGRE